MKVPPRAEVYNQDKQREISSLSMTSAAILSVKCDSRREVFRWSHALTLARRQARGQSSQEGREGEGDREI